MERGIAALMCAACIVLSFAGCSGEPAATGTSQKAVASPAGDAGPASTDLPDPYGLGDKTTAELRAELQAVMGSSRYADLPAGKREKVTSLLRFMARRRGYRPYEERTAFDPAAERGVSASSLSPQDGGVR